MEHFLSLFTHTVLVLMMGYNAVYTCISSSVSILHFTISLSLPGSDWRWQCVCGCDEASTTVGLVCVCVSLMSVCKYINTQRHLSFHRWAYCTVDVVRISVLLCVCVL